MIRFLHYLKHPDRAARDSLGWKLRRGFTLLEMLIVLVIIGLLAGLVGPQLLGRVETARVTTADTQVKMLKGALDTFRLDTGRYPTTEEGLAILIAVPKEEKAARVWHGPYLSQDVPLDPWGNPYQYRELPTGEVNLFSLGADGKPGGEKLDADIGLVPKVAPQEP